MTVRLAAGGLLPPSPFRVVLLAGFLIALSSSVRLRDDAPALHRPKMGDRKLDHQPPII
jgi:hypothetical protein